jgi:hypothetical protein
MKQPALSLLARKLAAHLDDPHTLLFHMGDG